MRGEFEKPDTLIMIELAKPRSKPAFDYSIGTFDDIILLNSPVDQIAVGEDQGRTVWIEKLQDIVQRDFDGYEFCRVVGIKFGRPDDVNS